MRKRNILPFVFVLILTATIIWANPTHWAGENNGWSSGSDSMGVSLSGWRTYTRQFTANSLNDEFKFTDGSWSNSWGSGSNITLGNVETGYYGGGNCYLPVEISPFYYTFRIQDVPDGSNSAFGVLKTSYNPVNIAQASSSPTTDTLKNGQALKVAVSFGGALHSEEYAIGRIQTDGWTTSRYEKIVMTGTDTGYVIFVPGVENSNPASTMEYYLMTSPYTSDTLSAANIDVRTLRWDTNGGSNFSKNVVQVNWDKMWFRGEGGLAADARMLKEADAWSMSKSFYYPFKSTATESVHYEMCGGEAGNTTPDWTSDWRRYGDIVNTYTEGLNRAVLGQPANGVNKFNALSLTSGHYYFVYIRTGDTYALGGDRKYGIKEISAYGIQLEYGTNHIGESETTQVMTWNAIKNRWEFEFGTSLSNGETVYFKFLPNQTWKDPAGHHWGIGPNADVNQPVTVGVPFKTTGVGVDSHNLYITVSEAGTYRFSVKPDTLEIIVEQYITSVEDWKNIAH